MTTRLTTTVATAALLGAVLPAHAHDQSARIAQLESRVAELESAPRRDGPALSFGAGTATSVEIYGYIKTDFVYDFGAELGNTTFGLVGLTDDDQGDFFNATAQQTRIGLRTTTPTSFGDLKTRLEIDFYGGAGAFGTADPYEPRVRHAYGELGGLLVGQTWTTFMPISSYPITLDFQGVAGIPFARQEMVRYTHSMGDISVTAAIEEANGLSDHPVFAAALAYDTDPLLMRVSGIAGEASDGVNEDDFYGVNLSTTAKLWEGGTIDAAYTYGEGIAPYLVFLGDPLNASGEAIEAQSAYLGLSQAVGDKLTLRAIYGWRENDEAGPSDDTETLTTLHLSGIYQLTETASLGAELFHGTRETFGGGDYDVDRIQTSFQIDF